MGVCTSSKDKNIKAQKKDKDKEEEGCVGSDYSDEDKYEEDNDNKNDDGIDINGAGDSGSEKDNNNIMKTQAEIKTKIGLNLIYNNNISNKMIDKKNKKRKIKVNVDENDKFNSK